MWNRPEFNIESFKKVTCNGFYFDICHYNNFDETKTLKFLKKIGITEIVN